MLLFINAAILWMFMTNIAKAQDIEFPEEGSSRSCFGGIMSYEKTAGVTFKVPPSQVLIASSDQAVTPDCSALCRQSNSCIAFTIEYKTGKCQAFDRDSVGRRELLRLQIGTNYLEEVCYRGVSNYSNICGSRIWAFERIIGAFLEGFDDKEEKNVASKVDCERLCLTEELFVCRSAEYDELRQLCRLSREDRRTQPYAFKLSPASSVDYLENQCLKPKPICRYELKPSVSVLSLDDLQYASNTNECEKTCDQTHLFSCWAFAFDSRQSRCYLSGDDTVSPSADASALPLRPGFIYGERRCISDQCSNGIMTYEKISAHTLRSALHEIILINTVGQGITLDCLQGCKDLGAKCPAMIVDYSHNKCFSLDRSSQGRESDVIPFPSHSFFEQICLKGPTQACHGKAWAFERVIRHELLGFDHRILAPVQNRRECEEACLQETSFVCRSAEYDYTAIECRLSKEDRRSRPQGFGPTTRNIDYLENQCLSAETNCRLERKEFASPTLVEFVQTQVRTEEECLNTCSAFGGFTCRTIGYRPNTGECLISSDDHASAYNAFAENHSETILFERTCQMSQTGIPIPDLPKVPPPPLLPPFKPPIEDGGIVVPPHPPIDTGESNYLPTPQAASSYLGGRCPTSAQGFIEYEKVTGYVLKADLMSVLISNDDKRGIIKECKDLCDLDSDCWAFNVDYNSSECNSLRSDSTLNRHDLETAESASYFEPICFRSRACGRLWTFERYLNKELRGHPKDSIQSITKAECEERCLFEIRFPCRSASYNHVTSECRLSNEDRFSKPDSFADAHDVDYLENQCSNILTSRQASNCQYTVTSRDHVLSFVDRVVQASSESECQRACDGELQFVCRSYSFTGTQGTRTSECYLSADTKNSVGAQLQQYPGGVYVERICPQPFPPTAPLPTGPHVLPPLPKPHPGPLPPLPIPPAKYGPPLQVPPGKYAPAVPGSPYGPPQAVPGSPYGPPQAVPGSPYAPPQAVPGSPYAPPQAVPGSPFAPPQAVPGSPYAPPQAVPGSPYAPPQAVPSSPHAGPPAVQYPDPSGSPTSAAIPGKSQPSIPSQSLYPSPTGMTSNIYPPKQGSVPSTGQLPSSSVSNQFPNLPKQPYVPFSGYPSYPASYPGQPAVYPSIGSYPTGGQLPGLYPGQQGSYLGQHSFYEGQKLPYPGPGQQGPYPPPFPGQYPAPKSKCDYTSDFIYEKTMGFAIRPLGRMESLPASITSQQIVADCLKACSQEGSRCQAFMIQYPFSPTTTPCLSLDRGIGLERAQLLPRGDTAYFEKICVKSETATTCGKMWTFERVAGFQLDISYDKELRNVFTKEDCEEACLAEISLPCRSASYIYNLQICRMTSETRRTKPEAFRYVGNDVDYLENQCAPEPSECEYTDLVNKFNPFTDRLSVRVLTLEDCKKSCDEEKEFVCRSISFDGQTNDCYLSAEDRFSTPAGPNIMIDRPGFTYSEKGGCGQVKVDCTQTEMLVSLRFGAPFNGRIYAKGNPQLCFIPGNSQNQVTMNIPIGTQCGTVEESQGRYANEIVIQQHPVIMTDHDKTYRVVCSFDMADKTLTFSPGGGGAIDVTIPRLGAPPPLITNTAPTPNVRLRITDRSGQDVNAVNLGDELYFRIEPDPYSAFGVFAKNLVARSEFLDYLPLLDNNGCPTDPNVFPSLELERGTRALLGPFKAFRFASTGRVNFEVQIQFCQDTCQAARCQYGSTFGRRKRNGPHLSVSSNTSSKLPSTAIEQNGPSRYIAGETTTKSSISTEKTAEFSTQITEVTANGTKFNTSNSISGGSYFSGSNSTQFYHELRTSRLSVTADFVGVSDSEMGTIANNKSRQSTSNTTLTPLGRSQADNLRGNDEGPKTPLGIMEVILPDEQKQRVNFMSPSSPSEMSDETSVFDVKWPQFMPFTSGDTNDFVIMRQDSSFRPNEFTPSAPVVQEESARPGNGNNENEAGNEKTSLPSEIPLRLSLTVNDDVNADKRSRPVTVNAGSPLNTDLFGESTKGNIFHTGVLQNAVPDVICTPKSTVIASIACIVLIHLFVICGATIWCRRRFRKKTYNEDYSTPHPELPTTAAATMTSLPDDGQHPMFYRPTIGPKDSSYRGIDFFKRYPTALHHSPLSMHPSHWLTEPNMSASLNPQASSSSLEQK